MRVNIIYCFLLLGFVACTSQKKLTKPSEVIVSSKESNVAKPENAIEKAAQQFLLNDSNLAAAHLGISIYDPAEKKYLYNYQGDKYFIPASNTKLLTCYAAMKYLGDSLVGLRYMKSIDGKAIIISGNGDPTFLHSDFKDQPVYKFLKRNENITYLNDYFTKFTPWGNGWAWNDYPDDYMAERSELPIYGNVVKFSLRNDTISVSPRFFYDRQYSSIAHVNENRAQNNFLISKKFSLKRELETNWFYLETAARNFSSIEIPFKTINLNDPHLKKPIFVRLLEDTLHKEFGTAVKADEWEKFPQQFIIHSQPTDSLLKITMHRSDNFFAEQTLLMVSNERLGLMSDAKIIDTLLKTDYKAMPQRPKWVDGSGLSRYNLISPQDFVFVLEKMKNEFAWNRITAILPTGNSGTLGGLYKNYAGKIYAKTGTVSNNLALSGYIITNQNKQLIFSVIVNNHQASASAIRRSIEKFITDVIDKN